MMTLILSLLGIVVWLAVLGLCCCLCAAGAQADRKLGLK
jgi:hypothetical protein